MKYFTAILSFFIFFSSDFPAQASDTILEPDEWKFSASNYFYLLPGSDYSVPVFTADHKRLHLEGRYNYEDFSTGSVFAGYNFRKGKKFEFNGTPMLAAVFGETNGIAPGLILDMYYRRLNLFSESEYLFDFSGKESSYFYIWSELTLAPVEWMRFGITIQRTKIYKTDFEVQRGLMLGINMKFLTVRGYIFNPGRNDTYGIVAVGAEF